MYGDFHTPGLVLKGGSKANKQLDTLKFQLAVDLTKLSSQPWAFIGVYIISVRQFNLYASGRQCKCEIQTLVDRKMWTYVQSIVSSYVRIGKEWSNTDKS